MTIINNITRRNVLHGIAAGGIVLIAGCTGRDSNDESPDAVALERLTVEETDLVIEFADDHGIDEITVIQPDGALFAEQRIATGVTRETIDIGMTYPPGEFEVIGSSDGDEQFSEPITIQPEVHIDELLLGRNHPDEMFEDASERRTRMEAIVRVRNDGTGADALTNLIFTGDVPRPTPEDDEQSGIYDTESETRNHADEAVIHPGESITIYSYSRPFTSVTDNVSCTPDTEEGEFEVSVFTRIQPENPSLTYSVSYTGEEMAECDIEIEQQQ